MGRRGRSATQSPDAATPPNTGFADAAVRAALSRQAQEMNTRHEASIAELRGQMLDELAAMRREIARRGEARDSTSSTTADALAAVPATAVAVRVGRARANATDAARAALPIATEARAPPEAAAPPIAPAAVAPPVVVAPAGASSVTAPPVVAAPSTVSVAAASSVVAPPARPLVQPGPTAVRVLDAPDDLVATEALRAHVASFLRDLTAAGKLSEVWDATSFEVRDRVGRFAVRMEGALGSVTIRQMVDEVRSDLPTGGLLSGEARAMFAFLQRTLDAALAAVAKEVVAYTNVSTLFLPVVRNIVSELITLRYAANKGWELGRVFGEKLGVSQRESGPGDTPEMVEFQRSIEKEHEKKQLKKAGQKPVERKQTRLCHICGSPKHIAKNCTSKNKSKKVEEHQAPKNGDSGRA